MSFQHLLLHGRIINRLAGQLLHTRPYLVPLFLGPPPDAFRHAVEVLVRLEDRFHAWPRGREGHDADHIRGKVEILRKLLDQFRAGEERDHLALGE